MFSHIYKPAFKAVFRNIYEGKDKSVVGNNNHCYSSLENEENETTKLKNVEPIIPLICLIEAFRCPTKPFLLFNGSHH